jgi:hypothetical protein
MIALVPLLVHVVASVQEPTPPENGPRDAHALDAEVLKNRIHEMRMNLLLGGDQVRRAETEAVDFYNQKGELVDQRLDGLLADLSEKRAAYEVLLDRALSTPDAAKRSQTLAEAAVLRRELDGLESDKQDLGKRRERIGEIVATIETRERERQKLATEIETSADYESGLLGLPYAGIGLAPVVPEPKIESPLAEDSLVRDLLERDPRAARRILFESDPTGYWQRFPLQPPADVLKHAIPFPAADLPGKR